MHGAEGVRHRGRLRRLNWPKITICILFFLAILDVVVDGVMIRFVLLSPYKEASATSTTTTTTMTTTTMTTTRTRISMTMTATRTTTTTRIPMTMITTRTTTKTRIPMTTTRIPMTTTITTTMTTTRTPMTTTKPTIVTPCKCDCHCNKCFSRNTNVTLIDGSHRPISRLRIGDRVLVFAKDHITSSPVLAVLTHLHAPMIDFIELHTSVTTLRLTPAHFLLVRQQSQSRNVYVRALDVSVGDFLFVSSSRSNLTSVSVTRITRRTLKNEDAYTPLTLEGTVIANDLVASCYSTHSPSVLHIITKPIQWWFWLLVKFELYPMAEWSSRVVVQLLDFYNNILHLSLELVFPLFT